MILENHYQLSELRKKNPEAKVAFCSGTFDLLHTGHIIFLEDCKKQGDLLFVMVGADSITKTRKGDLRPIFNERERMKILDSLKPVDYVFLDKDSDKQNTLRGVETAFEHLRPNVYLVRSDDFNQPARIALASKYGVELKTLEKDPHLDFSKVKTTEIIEKIKRLD